MSPDEDDRGHLGCWKDVGHRTQADAVRLYDVAISHGRRCLTVGELHGTANMPTTYRVVLETETRTWY